jgi:hypothetical protein
MILILALLGVSPTPCSTASIGLISTEATIRAHIADQQNAPEAEAIMAAPRRFSHPGGDKHGAGQSLSK